MRENSAKDFTRHTYLAHEIVFCSAGFLIVLITNSQQHIRGWHGFVVLSKNYDKICPEFTAALAIMF